MIHIEKIFVSEAPVFSEDKPFEHPKPYTITIDKIKEYGEEFFKKGFVIELFLSNKSSLV